MYKEEAPFKDKGKRIRNNSGERWASSRSGVNLLFMVSLNVFRNERQYFVLPGCEQREFLKIVSFKNPNPRGFSYVGLYGEAPPKRFTFLGFRYSYFKKGCRIKCTAPENPEMYRRWS